MEEVEEAKQAKEAKEVLSPIVEKDNSTSEFEIELPEFNKKMERNSRYFVTNL